ncbi:MAG TPA: amidohydrolase family protein [Verrucomicrobiota bacterium]|nr:hypothetical protein [Verrucomicrobiales bacterium]HRI12375.1 amidohydrolase family protein [Verrucomicrobiota bacterium]
MKLSMVMALVTSLISLATWVALATGANSGLSPVWAIIGLFWLATIGLPTSLGVVLVASIWGRVEPLSGLPGFLICSAALGAAFQCLTFIALRRLAKAAKAKGQVWKSSRVLTVLGTVGVLVTAGLWMTRPIQVPLSIVVDGHAHLFGDQGWPPVHNETCGLSPAQKANHTYPILTRLLHLPAQGDVNEAYVRALVGQVQEARRAIGSFRVVLLAQDCRYTEDGDPDWVNSSVYVPNQYLFGVVSRYPDWFLACPSINPQRKDWEAELEYCVAQGARVLKIHPPTQGVNPANPRFRAFYRKCAQHGVGIIFHTGAEHSAPIASSSLGDPRLLELALEEGCTVIAAHAGTKAFFEPPAEEHFQQLTAMMDAHPKLYADTAVLASLFRWRCIPTIVRTPVALSRMVHGSDWPFPSNAMVFWHRLHPFALVRLISEKNLFLRDILLKQALGMPPETFMQASRLFESNERKVVLRNENNSKTSSDQAR